MPGMDGTGPAGQGRKTGRGLGPCNTNMAGDNQGTGSSNTNSWLGFLSGIFGGFGRNQAGSNTGGRGMGLGRNAGRGRRR